METKHGGDIAPSSERYEQTTAEYEAIVAQKEQANSELVSCLASGDKLAVAKSLATLGRRFEVRFASHARAVVRLVPTLVQQFYLLVTDGSVVLRCTGAELVLVLRASGHCEAACFPLEGKSPA